ncbi:hypothetical protein [Frigidibacter sp. ROC022]|uniref:hypothetical protein n=1 Tax=Frigidibacter sp. ROC022 TaxID=2971796 RepID=UPI00215A9C62|nr:hypothetical protein [Frigidibacter sp. ROC022]MCR8726240.1 hypothetical protein [Frigidibacter sp. ROC022]
MSEPHALRILIHIAGAAALLIWAVRLGRAGAATFTHIYHRLDAADRASPG